MTADPRLIVALDLASVAEARALVEQLGETVSFYKIGYRLAFSGGLDLARALKAEGKSVFADLKLLDIDNTVAQGVESVAAMGVDMLTIHAYPKAIEAAAQAARGTPLTLLAVTVLTSMDDHDLSDAGYHDNAAGLVLKRARQAREAGMGGVVCSAAEAEAVRDIVGPDMAIVTPGIRPAGAGTGDQKRVVRPAAALAAGASHLVVGRPIIAAPDPVEAARQIIAEMGSAD